FHQWPVDVIAKSRRFEQRLLAILPILGGLTFRRRQPPFIDEAAPAQVRDGVRDQIAAAAMGQRALREKNLVLYVEASKIGPDHRHHPFDRDAAHLVEPLDFRPPQQSRAIFFRERVGHWFYIIDGL